MEIRDINFIAIKPQTKERGDIFLGFINIETDELQLNSIGVFQNLDGELKITWPAKKLVNASLKFYFKPTSEQIHNEIFNVIKSYLKKIKIFDTRGENYDTDSFNIPDIT